VLLSTSLYAQETSDLQPTPPGGPGSPYQPGMPVPQAPVAPSAAPGPSVKGTGESKGLIIYDDEEPLDSPSVTTSRPQGEIPETHVVKKGDTLWDLAAKYYGSPWAWPKLWAFNPSITNPHWIYPNDIIRLREGNGTPTATPEPGKGPTESPLERNISKGPIRRNTIILREGFVDEAQLASAGKIIGSKEEKIMLSTLDEAYVEFKKSDIALGEDYAVYQNVRVVRHPVTKKKLGEVVQIFGEAAVKTVQPNSKVARVLITDAIDPIERGYKVGPLKRKLTPPTPTPCVSPRKGIIVETMRINRNLIGPDHVIFIDKGRKDDIQLGNRFLVTRRGDGYVPLLAKGPVDDKRFPKEYIAEMIIVEVREHISTAIVTAAVKESRIGDAVECILAQ
jgi:hypothetical protein